VFVTSLKPLYSCSAPSDIVQFLSSPSADDGRARTGDVLERFVHVRRTVTHEADPVGIFAAIFYENVIVLTETQDTHPTAVNSCPFSSNFCPDVFTKPVADGGAGADEDVLTAELDDTVLLVALLLATELVLVGELAVAPGMHCEYQSFW
jgi:hypothetical protein